MKTLVLILALAGACEAASYTLNVTLSSSSVTAATKDELIQSLTSGPWLGTAKPNAFFTNTYTVTITGKNPAYQPPSGSLATLDSISDKLVAISSDSFVYGYASGMKYERAMDLSLVSNRLIHCSSETLINSDPLNCERMVSLSSSAIETYSLLCGSTTQPVAFGTNISEATCKKIVTGTSQGIAGLHGQCATPESFGFVNDSVWNCQKGLVDASNDIYQQNFSSPAVIVPGF